MAVRRFPYPYRAMLAICSDLDETPDFETYWEISRFLNTTEQTAMGPGVGLEVGNSIYFDMPGDQFSYWNTGDEGRARIRDLIRSGHIDCLHSYGDLATTRAHAGRALEELSRHDCKLEVWVDHATAPTNFGADIMRGFGDTAGHEAYHADLTCGFGVWYVWRGRVTSVTGQGVPRRLGGIWRADRPLVSSRAWAKELLKGGLGRFCGGRYRPHATNQVLWTDALRDGRPVNEFLRSNPHWAGVSRGETGHGIGEVLTASFLDRLCTRGAVSVLYTHLGKRADRRKPLPEAACTALRSLAERGSAGEILVATTRRLLRYLEMLRSVSVRAEAGASGRVEIAVTGPADEGECQGLSLYCDRPEHAIVRVNGVEVDRVRRNPADETGRRSVSIPWYPLVFPTERSSVAAAPA